MARKPTVVAPTPEGNWLTIAEAAVLLRSISSIVIERAIAGEFKFEADQDGKPVSVAEAEVMATRAATLAAAAKPKRKRAVRSPKQMEATWARMSADNAKHRRGGGGFYTDHHLRMTLPHPKPDEPE